MKYSDKIDVHTISLLISPGCNLKCEYCQMANQIHHEEKTKLWNDTIDAINDGSYLNNVVNTLYKLEQPVGNISRIELWGQEPTLILPELTEHWKEWYDAFFGLQRVFFSTNGMTDPENIFNFAVALDTHAREEGIHLEIQLSYDGIYGEEMVRGGSSDQILKNFLKLQDLINNYRFTKLLSISINFHAVMSVKLIKYFNTIDKLDKYYSEYEKFYTTLKKYKNNNLIHWNPPAFMYQNAHSATTQEGLEMTQFIQMTNQIKASKKYPHVLNFQSLDDDFALIMLGNTAMGTVYAMRDCGYYDFDEYIDDYFVNLNHPQRRSLDTCSTSIADLKIMYDGTIIMCQNSIFDTRIDTNLLNDSVDNWARYHFMKHGQVINVLKNTEEEVNKYYEYILNLRQPQNFIFMWESVCNMMYLLARKGQINYEYVTDFKKLKRHAYLFARTCWCYYNAAVLGGSMFVRNLGEIRQLCNGTLDYLDKYIQKDAQRRKANDRR